jgi:hypothetical protein
MRLESARDLKNELLNTVVHPFFNEPLAEVRVRRVRAIPLLFDLAGGEGPALLPVSTQPLNNVQSVQRSIALGVAERQDGFRLAIRLQRSTLLAHPAVRMMIRRARGEVDVRVVGRIDKRARKRWRASTVPERPWHQAKNTPLVIGGSVGHFKVTAGTLGCFVRTSRRTFILSNNHVLANENRAQKGDAILQPAHLDGGRRRVDRIARLSWWAPLKLSRPNSVDIALAEIGDDVEFDPAVLRGIGRQRQQSLRGLASSALGLSDRVSKIGRTTGRTHGRVSAIELDNVVVTYDVGNLRFDGLIEIEGTTNHPFSDGGDSGSLVVNRNREACALLFAGSERGGPGETGVTYIMPIETVLRTARVSFLV